MENGQIQTWEQSEQDSLAAGLAAGASGRHRPAKHKVVRASGGDDRDL